MKFLIVFAGLLAGGLNLRAEPTGTNLIYVINDGKLFFRTNNTGYYMDPQKVEAAKTNRECLPAKDFPEGNWGEPLIGYQLSLRFQKQVYANNEPINAILIIRDLTNQVLWYVEDDIIMEQGTAFLQVTSQNGGAMPPKQERSGIITGGKMGILAPGTQNRFEASLDHRYQLTNGMYRVRASVKFPAWKIPGPDGTNITYAPVKVPPSDSKYEFDMLSVKSGDATLEIRDAAN
jgi:hypothetical protein